jgi:hypothetical protein
VVVRDQQARRDEEARGEAFDRFARVADFNQAADRHAGGARDVVGREFVEIQRGADLALLEVGFGHAGARKRELFRVFAFVVHQDPLRRIRGFGPAAAQQTDGGLPARRQPLPADAHIVQPLHLARVRPPCLGHGQPDLAFSEGGRPSNSSTRLAPRFASRLEHAFYPPWSKRPGAGDRTPFQASRAAAWTMASSAVHAVSTRSVRGPSPTRRKPCACRSESS